ncbi:hypothetical protein BDW22DRAFT_1362933 [Trametopsis cervina]|nr:hypothetical protein BDW22DRAFT_1362933 [Trametopsis cervina]
MHAVSALVASLAACASLVSAKRVIVKVGANTTDDPSLIFQPQQVTATAGDVVVFTFENGTHTATQADFAAPCIPLSFHNSSVNGFNSGERPANNGTTVTTLEVPITDNTTTFWFYDNDSCGDGGVGGININQTSTETLDGFVRNAERLNGTAASSSSSSFSPEQTGSSGGGSSSTGPSDTSSTSPAGRPAVLLGAVLALPLAIAGLLL